jgi:hypothetical protein
MISGSCVSFIQFPWELVGRHHHAGESTYYIPARIGGSDPREIIKVWARPGNSR